MSSMTEVPQWLAQLQRLSAIGQLAAGIAHDVNNNLAAIIGPVALARETVARGAFCPETLLNDLACVEQAAQDAAQMLRRLQLFARDSAVDGVSRRTRVFPDELLDDVIALTRPRWRDQAQAAGRQITVVAVPGDAPAVLADPAELRELLMNLVTNAADAMPEGGTINILTGAGTLLDGASSAVLSVSDTGTGMDDATRSRLFEPFFTTKALGRGTGLGLAMAHDIVQRLGGAIGVDSVPGRGSTFTVRLPAAGLAAPRTAALTPLSPIRPLRILAVEDEHVLRQVMVRLLERERHVVTAVGSAEEALAHLVQQGSAAATDVVIADVGLPSVSGWQLARVLRADYPGLPIVIVSGWGESVTDEELAAVGVPRAQVVAKPYDLSTLQQALAAATAARTKDAG